MAYLGDEKDLIALPCPLEPFPNKFFTVTIYICSIPKCSSKFVGAVKELEASLVVVNRAVVGGETHCT